MSQKPQDKGAWVRVALGAARRLLPAQKPSARKRAPAPARPAPSMEDPLTGLLTRRGIAAALNNAFDRADSAGRALTLVYVSIDGYADVNDGYGYETGETVLLELARRLTQHVAQRNLIARFTENEFLLVLSCDVEEARQVATRLLKHLAIPIVCAGQEISMTLSAGVASYPRHGARHELLGNAVTAMRTASANGGDSFAEYDARMGVDLREQQELARDLRQAVDKGELELFYQPKIDACSLQVTSAEALLRWHHPRYGIVSPALFIPIAERHRLIGSIGNWVLEEAARQAGVWRDSGLRMRVAFNVSAFQMRQDDFGDRLKQALQSNRLQAARFTCEITETVAMEDTRVTHETFAALRKLGVHVSIDDFGTGHSSLAMLRKLPAAELKIDQSFVADLGSSPEARSIIAAVIEMAHALGLRVVAEGVEKTEQLEVLKPLGVDELQGFLFARPMPARSLGLWASDERTAGAIAFRASLFRETIVKLPG